MNNTSNITGAMVSFMDEVETYMIFKIGIYIDMYWFPVLIPIGLIGNTLSFLVMIKPNNRKMSTCIYMAAISINDNVMMILALHAWLVFGLIIYEVHSMECQIKCYWTFIQLQNGTFQVIAMTVDKYIAIKWPHKAAIYSTPRRAKLTVTGILICVCIYNIPHIFICGKEGNICLGYIAGGTFTKVYSLMSLILNVLIPFISLVYMNCVIIKKVRGSRKMLEGNEEGKGQIDISRKQKTMKNTENQITIMLLLVTTLFLVLMLPTYIRFLYTQIATTDTPAKYASVTFFYHLSHKLYYTNNGVNFFLYCISGKKFRNDLKEILYCGRKADRATSIRTGTSVKTEETSFPDTSTIS